MPSTAIAAEAAFDILDLQETTYDEPADGPRLIRVIVCKRHHGVIDGDGTAEVLTAQGDHGSGFVASERVIGTLAWRVAAAPWSSNTAGRPTART